jgi:integrase
MRDLNYELKRLGERNRDGSFATQANRWRILKLCADQLHELGYHKLLAHELKGRHVRALMRRWQQEALSVGTIKNRLAALRWWAEKVGGTAVMARGNDYYGLPARESVAQASKAQTLDGDVLARVSCPYVCLSLELQREFGLRREEAMKFQPGFADRGDHIALKDSWTKGGRSRVIPLTQASQREVLDRAHQLAGRGSLIPPQLTYVQQL